MLRILLLHPREWRDRRAGADERYLYEVFRRIAAKGHLVAWVASAPRRLAGGTAKRVEIVEGIQLAHLGWPVFYRQMARLLLPRLKGPGGALAGFDVLVEGVSGKPLRLGGAVEGPATPIVFRASRRLRPSNDPPGPFIAVSDEVKRALTARGVPASHIVRAPFGADAGEWDRTAERVLAVLENQTAV